VSPCQHDAVPRQNWLGPDGADLVLLRSACQKGYGCAANAAVGVVANANQCIYAMRVRCGFTQRYPTPDEAHRLCPDTEKQRACLMSSLTKRKGVRDDAESILFQEGPAVWSSHPDEESPMMEAWRDHQGQKRRATALAMPPPTEATLEDAVSFVQPSQPETTASNIIPLIQPVVRVRPGKTADGESLTKEYFFRVRASDATWLKALLDRWPIALPKLMLGVGLGWWSLPWHRMELPAASSSKGKATLSIHICDDQWRQLCANAAAANPVNPDPVRHCVMATLGRVEVPQPGPLLFTVLEQQAMQSVHRAIQLGHQTNLLSELHPDMNRLEKTLAQLRSRIEESGVAHDEGPITRLNALLKQLQDKANLCASATDEWREFLRTAATIAAQKTPKPKGAK